ncbi:hypothetical protein JDW15_09850 [Aerococcaceae bacterium zg-ZJ1578]|uniref:hypothetical protein n=1 Tax=Aerococcaceae bacterium zg-252 TaxID=2796928 RepID=UPI001A34C1E7|nr:hypothetical protein [Aerococcaceae bacterium zg-1578]
MSLLSKFLGTENYSISDSPMFQALLKNIEKNNYLSNLDEFEYDINASKECQKYSIDVVLFKKGLLMNVTIPPKKTIPRVKYQSFSDSILNQAIAANKEVAA